MYRSLFVNTQGKKKDDSQLVLVYSDDNCTENKILPEKVMF